MDLYRIRNSSIQLGMFLPSKPDRRWHLAAQAGVHYAVTKLTHPGNVDDLDVWASVKKRFAEHGFSLWALEGDQFDMTRIKLGLPGRDEDLEKYIRMLHHMGELDIKLLCYNFMAGIGWFRSRTNIHARGNALSCGFFPTDIPNELLRFSHQQLWENYEYFIKAVLPEAERAGIKMALHPDDPPVASLQGYPRIFTNAMAFRRMLRMTNSPNAGITFCAATFRQMGENDLALLEEWSDKIHFVHMRDNQSVGTGFVETFHDCGPTDLIERFAHIQQLGMNVLLRPDHAPTMYGESNTEPGYAATGRIFAIAYFKGILHTLTQPQKRITYLGNRPVEAQPAIVM